MAASANRMKLKNTPMDIWATRERLCLGSSVMRSGDQNWVSVSRAIKPFGENNRPADWFSQKNCARQYADLLEKVETPKRKRGERGEIETPGESIVRKLTLERIEELKMIIQQEQQQHHKLRTEIDMIQNGHFDDKLEELWQQVLDEKKKEEQAVLDHQKWLQDREVAIATMLTAPKSKMPTTPISKQKKPAKPPRTGVVRRSSSQSEPGSEAESTSNSPLHEALNVEVDIPSIAPKPPQPTSPLLTSLLKSPTAASGFSILHSAITQPKEGGRMVPTTSASAISTLLSSSPCKSNLLASAFNLDPEIPTRPPTTSPSAGAPTLSRLLEMPLASPGKPLPPLPVVTPEAEQSPPIEATPDPSTDTVLKQDDTAEQEQTEVTSTCIPVSSASIEEETIANDPSDNVVTEVTVMDEPEQIPVVSESVVVMDSSSVEAEPADTIKEELVSDIVEVPVETETEHIPEEANLSSLDVKLEGAEEVVVEETASVEIKEEPVTTSCTEVEIQDEDFQVVQEELVEAVAEEEAAEISKDESIKVEEAEDDTSFQQTVEEVEAKSDDTEASKVSLDEEPKPSSPLKVEPEPDSETEVRSETPSSVKEQPAAAKASETPRGRGRGRGRGRRSFPTRTLHHSGSNDSKPKDSPKPDSDDESDEESEDEAPKKAAESGKAREKTSKLKDDSESKDREDRKSSKKEDGRTTRRDEGKSRKDDVKGKKVESKEDGKGRKSDRKEDGKAKKSDGKDEGKSKKADTKEDGKGKKSEGKEDVRRRKSEGKDDAKGRKFEGKDDTKVKKGDAKEDGKEKRENKETTDDERSRSRKRSSKDEDAKDTKVSKKEEPAKEKKVDGRRRKTTPPSVDNSATQDGPKLPPKVAEDKEEKEAVTSDNDDSPAPEAPKVSRRGKERKIEREESLPDDDDDDDERDESSNLSKPLFPSDSIPNSPASNAQSDDHEGLRDYKVWKKAIMLVWRSAATHKFANVFLHPVTEEVAPGYKVVVYRPMDLSQIKKNIENGVIKTTAEFQRDMMLMFQNAIMYNSSDHDVYAMAVEMQKEVMCHIQDFLATQLMVQTAEIPKTLRRETRELAQKRTSESFSDIKQTDDSKRSGSESEGSKPKKRRMRTADD